MDFKRFGAAFAYTVDGDAVEEINYESGDFNFKWE